MSPICPECEQPFSGRPARTRAARVCKACGHAFLLSPDGTTESLKKKKEPEPEPEPAEQTDESAEGADAAAEGDANGDAAATADAGAAEASAGMDGDIPPAFDLPDVPPLPEGPGGTQEFAEGDFEAQGWSLPSPVPETPPPSPAEETAPAEPAVPEPVKSGPPMILLPVLFLLGAAAGYGAQFVLAPEPLPPPPPPPPPVEVPEPEPVALPPQVRFINAEQPMWEGPMASGTYKQVAVLPKGSAVLMTTAEVESFVLVHDAMGRAGFVSSAALAETRPEAPFVDCARAPFETEDGCKERASKQHEACASACGDQTCTDTCKTQLDECVPQCAEVGFPVEDEGKSKRKRGKGKRRGRKGKSKAASDDDDDDFIMPEPVRE